MGENCTDDVNECLSNPCLNNATCVNLEDGYRCDCVLGWEGAGILNPNVFDWIEDFQDNISTVKFW